MAKWRLLMAVGAVALLVALAGSAAAQVTPPARFWGVLKIDGQDPPEETEILAFIDGKECGRGKMAGRDQTIQGLLYVVDVVSDGQESDCGEVGDVVTFTVDGRAANETGKWNNEGGFLRLDLTVGAAPEGAPLVAGSPAQQPPAVDGAPAAATAAGALAEQPQATGSAAESGSGFPWWIVGVVAGAVVVTLGGAAAFLRRRGGAGSRPAG